MTNNTLYIVVYNWRYTKNATQLKPAPRYTRFAIPFSKKDKRSVKWHNTYVKSESKEVSSSQTSFVDFTVIWKKNPFAPLHVTTSSFLKLSPSAASIFQPDRFSSVKSRVGFASFLFRSTSTFAENRWNSSGRFSRRPNRFRFGSLRSANVAHVVATRRDEKTTGATMPVNLFPHKHARSHSAGASTALRKLDDDDDDETLRRLVEDANRALNRLTF